MDATPQVVQWLHWFVAHKQGFHYSESNRWGSFIKAPGTLPVSADCSATYALACKWANVKNDPNKTNWTGGYTGTMLAHGTHITIDQVKPGDAVVYGPGTGWHTAGVVEVHGHDILTVSHGQEGDPSYVWVNVPKTVPARGFYADARTPQTFLRFDLSSDAPRSPVALPAPNPPHVSSVTTATPTATPMPTIQSGAKGAPVFKMQQLLALKGFSTLKIDGVFGAMSEAALRQFQANNGLQVDGICGARSWEALGA